MFRYIYFDDNGRITNDVTLPKELPSGTEEEPIIWNNCILDSISDINLSYFDGTSIVPKLVQNSSINTLDLIPLQECTIINLPNPCLIDITQEGVYYVETVIEGTAKYAFDTPGEVKLTVNALHYLPKEFTVNVN